MLLSSIRRIISYDGWAWLFLQEAMMLMPHYLIYLFDGFFDEAISIQRGEPPPSMIHHSYELVRG